MLKFALNSVIQTYIICYIYFCYFWILPFSWKKNSFYSFKFLSFFDSKFNIFIFSFIYWV